MRRTLALGDVEAEAEVEVGEGVGARPGIEREHFRTAEFVVVQSQRDRKCGATEPVQEFGHQCAGKRLMHALPSDRTFGRFRNQRISAGTVPDTHHPSSNVHPSPNWALSVPRRFRNNRT